MTPYALSGEFAYVSISAEGKVGNSIKSISFLWLGSMLGAVLAFATQLFLARTLSIEDYGGLAAVTSLITILTPLAGLGANGVLLQQYGTEGAAAYRWARPAILLVATTNVLILALLAGGGTIFWAGGREATILYLLLPYLPLYSFLSIAVVRLQIEGRFSFLSVMQVLPQVLRFIVAAAAFFLSRDVYFILKGYFSGSIVATLFILLLVYYAGEGSSKFWGSKTERASRNGPSLLQVTRQGVPFAIGGFLSLVYFQSVIFLLSVLDSNATAGEFQVALAIMMAIYLLPTAVFNQYLLPRYHYFAEHDRKTFLEYFRFCSTAMFWISIATMIALQFSAAVFVPLFFGKAYGGSVKIIYILACSIPFRFLSASAGGCLFTKGTMKKKVHYQAVVALVSIALNLGLIPLFGGTGAAVATVLTEFALFALFFWGVNKHIFGRDAWRGWHLDRERLHGKQ